VEIRSRFTIAAETSGQSSVDRLGDSVGKLNSNVSHLPALARTAAAGIAAIGALAVPAMLAATKQAIDFASGIKDASTAAGLSTDTFQSLGFAAQLAGINAESFAGAMSRANKAVGDAANGTGAAAKVFERLGISVRDANGDVLPLERVINQVADALSNLESPAERASVAAAVFGREAGPKLAAVLAQGSEGLATLADEARNAGAVIDQSLIDQADEAGDKLDAMATVVKAQLTSALVALTPTITAVAQAFADAAPHVARFFAILTDGTAESIAGEMGTIEQAIAAAQKRLASANAEVEKSVHLRELEELQKRLKELQDQYTRVAFARQRAIAGEPLAAVALGAAVTTGTTKTPKAPKGPADDPSNFAGADAIRSAEADAEYYRDLQQAVDGFIRSADEELPRLLDDVTSSVQETSGATVDAYLDAFGQMEAIADAAAGNIADILTDGVFALFDDGVDGMVESFNRALKQIAADIINSQIREALRSVFTDALGGGYGGLLTAVIGAFAGGTGKTGSASVSKNATGGSFVVPGPNSGDRVIPIFRANGGERVTITPNGVSGPGGGTQIVNNIDARGADPASEARIQAAIRDSERRTIAQVAQLARRGRL
jgi:uncharacterized phage infection (PIP) family protein YhgE